MRSIRLAHLVADLDKRAGGNVAEVRRVLQRRGIAAPSDYLEFMSEHDGGAGMVGGGYVDIWPSGELELLNDRYAVDEFAPGLTLFGSDGGDNAYAFQADAQGATRIVKVPFIPMSLSEATMVGRSFEALMEAVAQTGDDDDAVPE